MHFRLRRHSIPIAVLAVAPLIVSAASAPSAVAGDTGQPSAAEQLVDKTMDQMTLPEKVGQLFVDYVYGDTATTTDPQYTTQNQALYGVDNGAALIAKYHLGGIIDFTWTGGLQNPPQIAGLSNGLQSAAMAQDPAVPLLISTDQEGGNVVRVGAPAAVSPGNMAIGGTFSPSVAYDTAAASGTQLRAMGINVDDAPVVDVNTNPANAADGPRAFGDNTPAAAAMGTAAINGYQSHGVAATAKHFPGLGSTTVNTDNGPAVTDETKAQIFARDIPSFQAAIAAGTDMIMAAHIVAPALDPTNTPASLSEPIVTGILRNQLHYRGVVITDALSAGALSTVPSPQRAVEAIEAGDDQLLMPESLPDSYRAVLDAVHDGTITMGRINQSVRRILALKVHLGLFGSPYADVSAVAGSVGTPDQLAAMAGAARRSITLVKNDGTLPLAEGSGKHVLVTGWGASSTQTLTADVAGHGVVAQRLYTGTSPGASTIAAAVAAAKSNDLVVVTTDNASANTAQQALVTALLGAGKPVIVAALGTPYDIGYFDQAPTFLAAYGYQNNTLEALADILFGAQPSGRLPVTVPLAGDVSKPLYPYGTGLHYGTS